MHTVSCYQTLKHSRRTIYTYIKIHILRVLIKRKSKQKRSSGVDESSCIRLIIISVPWNIGPRFDAKAYIVVTLIMRNQIKCCRKRKILKVLENDKSPTLLYFYVGNGGRAMPSFVQWYLIQPTNSSAS